MAALRRDPIGLTTGTQGSSMPVIYSNMHGFGIRFQEIDTDTLAGQARDLQQHARLTCMYGRMHIYSICIYEGCKPMTNKQARSSCKPQILPCIHASTLDVLTNNFATLVFSSWCISPTMSKNFASTHGSTPFGSHYACSKMTPCTCLTASSCLSHRVSL